jgi:hypothetical protein
MNEPKPPRRRWFQFGLRTMFVVVAFFAIWLGYQANWVRQRHDAQAWLDEHLSTIPPGAFLDPPIKLSWTLRLFGEEPKGVVFVVIDSKSDDDRQQIKRMRRLFPEAHFMNPNSTDGGFGL